MLFGTFTVLTIVATLTHTLYIRSPQEYHAVSFINKCGHGTPTIVKGNEILPLVNGTLYNHTGSSLSNVIAYLQTNDTGKPCKLNGEGCLLVEITLNNPVPNHPGSGSSVDLSLINPHKYNVETSIAFTTGYCKGLGARCSTSTCKTAFNTSDDNYVQKACQEDNASIEITFCGGYFNSSYLPDRGPPYVPPLD